MTDKSRLRAIRIDLADVGPEGTDLRVFVNGRELFDEVLQQGPWSRTFAVGDSVQTDTVVVQLVSSTFQRRGRKYGVAVAGIWLLTEGLGDSTIVSRPSIKGR